MKILMISTVREFFRQRAGMFFVILGVLFGFLSSREHYAFALFFLTDAYGMVYLSGIWLLYTILCCQFISSLWTAPEYAFIYQARIWFVGRRITRFLVMAIALLQPLLFYGAYVTSIANQDRLLSNVWPIFVTFTLLSCLVVAVAEWRIRRPRLFAVKKSKVFNWPFPRPVSWIYWSLEWLLREKGLTFLACKTGAIGVVSCTLLYYSTDTYDLRLPAIGLSLGYLLNIGLSYELYGWENVIWLWGRSLPVSLARRFVRTLSIHALLILPETLIAIRYGLLTGPEIVQLYLLGLALIMLFHVYLYKRPGLLEESLQPVLTGFVILTLLILYKIPILAIASLALIFSYFKYTRWYNRI